MSYPMIQAKPISYGGARALSNIKYIAIHNTGNVGDTARNNADFFGPSGSNTRIAGAHFFVDQAGSVYQSIPINITAWAVGDNLVTTANGAASYRGKCTNFNSVSIELCDIITKSPSQKMIDATRELVKYIQKQCPNAKTFVRHWDVSGKNCPERMMGKTNSLWESFKKAISGDPPANKKPIFYGYSRVGLNVYKNKPNWKSANKKIAKDTLVYAYATYSEKMDHYDGEPVWVWWAINPECTEWVVYTNRISRNKVFAQGTMKAGLTSYKKPNGSTTGKFYPSGTKVKCYGTFTDDITHSDGKKWVWWRITPLLDNPEWLVYTSRIRKEG